VITLVHGGGRVWLDEAFFLVRRHKNKYLDISSIPPQKLVLEYFPQIEDIVDKVLFGTDRPGLGMRDGRKTLLASMPCQFPRRPGARFSMRMPRACSR